MISQMTWAGMTWLAVLVAAAICYAIKLAGLSLPQRLPAGSTRTAHGAAPPGRTARRAVATQTFSTGQHLVLDVRAAALAVAPGRGLLRAPFLVVVAAAAATAALLRRCTAEQAARRSPSQRIEAVTELTPAIHEALGRLLPQLNATLPVPDIDRLQALIADPDVDLAARARRRRGRRHDDGDRLHDAVLDQGPPRRGGRRSSPPEAGEWVRRSSAHASTSAAERGAAGR